MCLSRVSEKVRPKNIKLQYKQFIRNPQRISLKHTTTWSIQILQELPEDLLSVFSFLSWLVESYTVWEILLGRKPACLAGFIVRK